MNKSTQSLALTAFLAAAASCQAGYTQGDVIVGFTSGAGNDTLWDLGQVSALTPGETWNVGANLGSSFGAVAVKSSGSYNGSLWTTVDASKDPGLSYDTYNNTLAVKNGATGIRSLGSSLTAGNSLTISSSLGNSWNQEAALPVASAANTALESALGFMPTVADANKAYFYEIDVAGGSLGAASVAADGVFAYDSGSGVLGYSVIPEPSTCLIAGVGVLVFYARRRSAQA